MAIHRVRGTIIRSDAQTLTNTVNCVGVMGKGIAQKFKRTYPEMFRDYENRCFDKLVRPGEPYVYDVSPARKILNFPTKDHWRGKSRIEWIEGGLQIVVQEWEKWGVKSLAVPPLGCGHGGLEWADVEPLIVSYLSRLPIEVQLYVPEDERLDPDQMTIEF
jgi:O-acetyl-ADP-ribose deacetylase (regulator of RNase III)